MILLKKTLLTKILAFSSLFLTLSFFSCSNSQESKLVYTENDTIKQSVKEKEQNITWTQELEEGRLSERITRGSMQLGPDVSYSKELFKISTKKPALVYPSLSDFGSLDTSNLQFSVKDKLTQFCTAFSEPEHSGAADYFSRKYVFNYVFFVNDIEENWKRNFGKELSKENPLFPKWTFGQPFNGSDIIQIPVRFYADCGTIDVTVFLINISQTEDLGEAGETEGW